VREAGNLQGQALALLNIARLQEFQGNILAACEAWQEVYTFLVLHIIKLEAENLFFVDFIKQVLPLKMFSL